MVTSNGNLAREKVKGSPWLTLTKGKQGSTRAETHWAILTEHKDQSNKILAHFVKASLGLI